MYLKLLKQLFRPTAEENSEPFPRAAFEELTNAAARLNTQSLL